jgi:hypothetical protein
MSRLREGVTMGKLKFRILYARALYQAVPKKEPDAMPTLVVGM